jgi:hypothetical protein
MKKRFSIGLLVILSNPIMGFAEENLTFNNQPVNFWVTALQNRQSGARISAANVLGLNFPPTPASVDALIAALDDRVVDVRLAAISSLGHFGPAAVDSAPKLARLLTYDNAAFDPSLAKQAASALANVQPNGGGPLIAALLKSGSWPVTNQSLIDLRLLELLSDSIKDQQSAAKRAATVKGIGQLFTKAAWDKNGDKSADSLELQLKAISGPATEEALLAIKGYRDRIRIRFDSVKYLLDPDPQQWKNVIKSLAASRDGIIVLETVVAEKPESAIVGVILKEW